MSDRRGEQEPSVGLRRLQGCILRLSCRRSCGMCQLGFVSFFMSFFVVVVVGLLCLRWGLVGMELRVEWRSRGDGSVHLLSTEDETLLDWWDSFLLFYALLYAGHLWVRSVSLLVSGVRRYHLRVAGEVLRIRATANTCSGDDNAMVVPCSLARCPTQSPCPSGCVLCGWAVSWVPGQSKLGRALT